MAYWDTEGGSRPPRLLGEYQGTPTIRLFKPKKKQRKKGSNSEKIVLDYQHGERNVRDMKKFLEYQIPNYVERIKFGSEDYDKIKAKADKYGLPIALLFTSKASTSTNVKWLSTEFRRKLLVVEVPPVTKNANLRKNLFAGEDNVDDAETLPALYIIPPGSSGGDNDAIIKYESDDYKRRKLQEFFNAHALKEPVFEPIGGDSSKKSEKQATSNDAANDQSASEPPKKEKVEGVGSEL